MDFYEICLLEFVAELKIEVAEMKFIVIIQGYVKSDKIKI